MTTRKLTAEETRRIDDLVGLMSLEEKMAQITGIGVAALLDEDERVAPDKLAQHLGNGIGQITISAGATTLPAERTAENANTIQRFLREKTRHGIPAIFNDECVAGFVGNGATHFPQAIGMGAAWRPELSRRMAGVIRRQARATGSHLMYSPVFDLGIDPRWGRTEETWGEDPYLASRIGVAFVEGLRGEDLGSGVVATLKHFAGYSVSEGGRNCGPAHMGPRELRDVHLVPFEAAVKEGGAESVMAAYHAVDGVPCAGDRRLLTGILREEWGFEGVVVADWGTVQMLYQFHHTAADATDAGRQALAAGLDIETPEAHCYAAGLIEAVRRGEFPEAIVDKSLRRHLRVKTLLGLFDDALVDPGRTGSVYDTAADRSLALEAARASMTLLKNEDGLLPLSRDVKRIAVIGPNADRTHALLGDYSYSVYRGELGGDAVKLVSVLEGIRGKAASGAQVIHAAGCGIMDDDTGGFDEAVSAAADADVVIAVLGGKSALHRDGTSGENIDRAELSLPGAQEALLKALCATGKPVVLVLLNGRPLAIEWAAGNVPAILEAWLPGEEGGSAVADVLFGDVNPGGKLPVSLLRAAGQSPSPYHVCPSSFAETAHYAFTDRTALYPFGHGLSYTQFAYSGLEIGAPAGSGEAEEVSIRCRVTNTGSRAGDETVQLYVRDPVAGVARPRKELKGFARISLAAGAAATVTFALPVELLAFHGADLNLVVEAGEVRVMLGSSSEDIRLQGAFEIQTARTLPGRRRFRTDVVVAGAKS